MKKLGLILVCFYSAFANAAVQEISNVYLDSVGVIGPAAFGHQAGNMEIKVKNGLGSAMTLGCDKNYVTTKNTVPNYKEMVAILIAAQASNKPVRLGLSNDSSSTAFTGRCSLVAVNMLN